MFIVKIFGVGNNKTSTEYFLSSGYNGYNTDSFYLSTFFDNVSKFSTKDKALLAINQNRGTIRNWFNAKEEGLFPKYEILEVTYTVKEEGLL